MSLKDRWSQIDRVQQSRLFKILATALVFITSVAVFGWYAVSVTSGTATGLAPGASEETARIIGQLLERSQSVSGFGVLVGSIAIVACIVVWLGLGLTYLGLLLFALGLAWPLSMYSSTAIYARLLIGIVALTASFTALMQGVRILLSGPGPVMAIARNVLAEAVRMRVSLVFIVLLIFGLAALPGVLDSGQPLRYRLQSFLQYSTGGSFWLIAVLTLVFGVTTLSNEQRTRVIWQTMTKPVPAWKYLLGKWIGIVALQGVLLSVCCTGIFLFVEYLRSQPAYGEVQAYVAADGGVSEDRLILETQVLTAVRRVDPVNPYSPSDPDFLEAVEEFIRRERVLNPEFATYPAERAKVQSDLFKSLVQSYRSIDPINEMVGEMYTFTGLERAKARDLPITLRYRVDAAGNRPDEFYILSFLMPTGQIITRRTALGINHTITLSPEYIGQPAHENPGELSIRVYNGELRVTPDGVPFITPNPATITFPPGGIEIAYRASGFQINFVRVAGVLWIKLAFLAMLSIWAATFLSFSVASLVAISVFLMAESAGFLTKSMESFSTTDHSGKEVLLKQLAAIVSTIVARFFSVYSELRPVDRLVQGRIMSWQTVAVAVVVLSIVTFVLYAIGVAIFRKRQLAVYSGQG
ncbi:MAG: hypothetical protein KF757_06570 [Phycisphaeraceae bacterium]|nr:hypothetical protein [Phycisphaeraceae bacterium]MCW5763267.1 hypothetical protein [Phycisphaeraceae bacterium]